MKYIGTRGIIAILPLLVNKKYLNSAKFKLEVFSFSIIAAGLFSILFYL